MLAGDESLARTLVQAAIDALLPALLSSRFALVLLCSWTCAPAEPLDLDTLRADLQALEA